MIRVKTLRYLSATRKSVFRVRRRVVYDGLSGRPWKCDKDGRDSDPMTWERWEEEYYVQRRTAELGARQDAHKAVRPRGLIDQVPAHMAWERWKREPNDFPEDNPLSDFDRGRYRVIGPLQGGPGVLECDRPVD